MLTGPVTILNWSFPRADISRELQCKQLALALRDEVVDLEKAGIKAVQVDEPALREGVSVQAITNPYFLTHFVISFLSARPIGTPTLDGPSHLSNLLRQVSQMPSRHTLTSATPISMISSPPSKPSTLM